MINDKWYQELEEHLGNDFCYEAGYFDEELSWNQTYDDYFFLPRNYETVIQFSGAFFPIHDGHWSIIKSAIDAIKKNTGSEIGVVVLHVDHEQYRKSKGKFPEKQHIKELNHFVQKHFPYEDYDVVIIKEDRWSPSCSRNFTKLYKELYDLNENVYFLSGGDRANYALTFISKGKCIIAGRDDHPNFEKYRSLANDRLWFLAGNHPASSTKIREQVDKIT